MAALTYLAKQQREGDIEEQAMVDLPTLSSLPQGAVLPLLNQLKMEGLYDRILTDARAGNDA
jgi:hypothetical protein